MQLVTTRKNGMLKTWRRNHGEEGYHDMTITDVEKSEKRRKEEEEVELGLRRMWRMGNYGLAH